MQRREGNPSRLIQAGGDPIRSTRCQNTSCVEVALINGTVEVGDTKNPNGPKLLFDGSSWKGFISDLQAGEFDRNK